MIHKVGDLVLRCHPNEIGVIVKIKNKNNFLPYVVKWCEVGSLGHYDEEGLSIMKRRLEDEKA